MAALVPLISPAHGETGRRCKQKKKIENKTSTGFSDLFWISMTNQYFDKQMILNFYETLCVSVAEKMFIYR